MDRHFRRGTDRWPYVTVGLLLVASLGARAQQSQPAGQVATLTDDEIATILSAPNGGTGLRLTQSMSMGHSGYVVHLWSPASWIRDQAATAKHEMRPFGPADVADDVRRDVWHMHVEPDFPDKLTGDQIGRWATNVTHAVIRNEAKTIVIQPLTKTPFPQTVKSAMQSLTLNGMDFEFPSAAILDLWGKNRDQAFWVTVIGDKKGRDYDFEIKDKHFLSLR